MRNPESAKISNNTHFGHAVLSRPCPDGGMRWHRGFTLVELLIVIALIGIISAMIAPFFRTYVGNAKVARCQGDLAVINNDVQAFYLERNAYPPDLTAIARNNMRDAWGRPFGYATPAALDGFSGLLLNGSGDYDLFSMGENGLSTPGYASPACDDDIVRASDGSAYHLRKRF